VGGRGHGNGNTHRTLRSCRVAGYLAVWGRGCTGKKKQHIPGIWGGGLCHQQFARGGGGAAESLP